MPLVALDNAMVLIEAPEQMVCDDGVATATGEGFTTTVAVVLVPGQLFAVGVMVNVTVTGEAVALFNTPLISLLPLAAMPVIVTSLSLVHA